MTTLLLWTLAQTYRPYVECDADQPRTLIEVSQNVTPENGLPQFSFNLKRKSRGKITQLQGLSAEKIPTKRKQVIEVIAATNSKGIPAYELMIFTPLTDDGFVAQFMDHGQTQIVYCNYPAATFPKF